MKPSHMLMGLSAAALIYTVTYGSLRTLGGLEVGGDTALNGDAGIARNLEVLGDAGFRDNLFVRGSAEIAGNLSASNGTFSAALTSLSVSSGDAGFNLVTSRTEHTLWSIRYNAINGVGTFGGVHINQPHTVRDVSVYASTPLAGAGANTNVIRVSDGTNNCDATFTCTTLSTAGLKAVTPTGTCAFAAGSLLTVSTSTASCTPNPVLLTVVVRGNDN